MIGAMILLAMTQAAATEAVDPRTPIQRANAEMMVKHYPKGALKRGEEGSVGLSVTIDQKGYPIDCRVTKSSGYRDLDGATCEVIVMYGRTKPFLDGNRRIVKTETGEFNWTLPAGVAKAKVAAANNESARAGKRIAANSPNRMICRTQGRIGSLAIRQRICMTSQEWMAQRETSQKDTQDMQRRSAMDNN